LSTVTGNVVVCIEQYLAQHAHVLESRVLPIFKDIADSRARNRDELDGKLCSLDMVKNS